MPLWTVWWRVSVREVRADANADVIMSLVHPGVRGRRDDEVAASLEYVGVCDGTSD